MALTIVWSNEAEEQLDRIIAYLESNWTEKESRKFFSRLEESLQSIANNPGTYKNSLRKKGVKEFLLTPHNSIFYTFDSKNLYIISVWANKKHT